MSCIYRYGVPNLKANHNRRKQSHHANWLYLSIWCSEFESKSQLLERNVLLVCCCIYRYGVPNLKANHNLDGLWYGLCQVVSIDMVFRI